TRAYPVNEKTGKIYFLKDSWRIAAPESDVLKDLNATDVRNAPLLICGGDISNHIKWPRPLIIKDGAQSDTGGVDPSYKQYQWLCDTKHIHYRLTEGVIGMHLDKFTSTKEMMTIVRDAFIGDTALTKCNILHRDVSGNNIMTKRGEERGILNDWDLTKRTNSLSPHRHERAGTWKFISTLNLMIPGKVHEVQDDLESFILVVLYHALRYSTHNGIDKLPAI
ncbi:hypothetical protein BDZ94DRAFT_1172350, partial [Collybia nuda]